MCDGLIFSYSIQLSFVIYLKKFHVCTIMPLRCSRKLETFQVTRAKLVLKLLKFLILFIISREISYSFKTYAASAFLKTVIEQICDWNFKSPLLYPKNSGKFEKYLIPITTYPYLKYGGNYTDSDVYVLLNVGRLYNPDQISYN